MRSIKLSELPIIPQDYETDNYSRIDWNMLRSEMADCERRFIHGLVRYYNPANVLEIGVSSGAGTVNLLWQIGDQGVKRKERVSCTIHNP